MQILGWNDDILDCDVCGKHLDRTRTLAYLTEEGEVRHCAALLMGTTTKRVCSAADAATRRAEVDAVNVDRWTRCLAAFRGTECPTREEWDFANRCWEVNSRSFEYKGAWLDWIEARLAEKLPQESSCLG